MTLPCGFTFSVSDTAQTVDEKSELWSQHLPASRHPGDTRRSPATVGDYFTAAARFLSQDSCRVIDTAVYDQCGRRIAPKDISLVHICLVKHGTFYHPAHVIVSLLSGQTVHMALNLAVSPEGCQCIDREFAALENLTSRTKAVPAVYGKGDISPNDGIDCAMFCAQWFEDFHEFHLSLDQGALSIVVWDDSLGSYFLTQNESMDLYRQASTIMTSCYNPLTCEQIQPWHHAAGDFVVNRNEEGLTVRLITVRQYTSMFASVPDDPDVHVDAALIFLISLSIRMRLDRIDGIKDTAWAKDFCVSAVVSGFFEGLEKTAPQLVQLFKNFVFDLEEEDLSERARMVIGAYHPDSPDLVVIQSHLDAHVALLTRILKTQDVRNADG